MGAQDNCVAFLGAGGVGNTPLIVKAANSPTWLYSVQAVTSHQFYGNRRLNKDTVSLSKTNAEMPVVNLADCHLI